MFADQPIRITGYAASGELADMRCDGLAAMLAAVDD
jgi:hypothetical protein